MSFEVHPIENVTNANLFSSTPGGPRYTANEIAKAYQDAKDKGGSIIAAHTVHVYSVPETITGFDGSLQAYDRSYDGQEYLMLVAELPDITPEA